MSLSANPPNSLTSQHTQPLVLNDDTNMEVFDFSTLRDELDVDHSEEEHELDGAIEFEETGDTLEFEFAADIENFTSTTFEEEAFGVKKPGPRTKEGSFKQSQPNLWNKDPFAGPSYGSKSHMAGETGKPANQMKKITRRVNPPPISREISTGISFASILSGSVPQEHNVPAETSKRAMDTDVNVRSITTTTQAGNDTKKTHQLLPLAASETGQPPSSMPKVQEMDVNGQNHTEASDPTQPAVYSVADIEAGMGQQQRSPNKNLLYQLLPGLSQQQQQQQQSSTTLSFQNQSSKQVPVDINSFFQKHQQRQQQQPSTSRGPAGAATTQQPPVDINSFFQKHHQQQQQQLQQAQSASHASNAALQHTSTTTIHKPNMTTEQEIKQKEDDGKDSYDGLMTAKNIKYIDQIERSKLADSNQHTPDDFYYHMYTAHHGGQSNAPPVINQAATISNPMVYHQSSDFGEDNCATLDKVLDQVIQNHDIPKDGPFQDDKKRSKNDHQQLLKTIESIYFLVLQVEQSYREVNGAIPSIHNSAPSASTTRQETMSKIWEILAMDQSSPTVISILKVNKGMSLIGRLVPHLNDSQRQILMTTIAYYFVDILPPSLLPTNSTDAHGSHQQQQQPQHQRQNVDYIHPSISGCLEHILFGASLSYISQILSSASNHPDFKLLLGTTTGHRFLGTLLFHAMGKQQQQQYQQESDCKQWRTSFGSYFDKAMESSSLIKNMAHLDNLGVWMLLNSMVGCCNPQQKELMANAYRETVSVTMKTISDLERNRVPVPYAIQGAYPVVNELWSNLSLGDESLEQTGHS
ncbi:topoisomerase II-associated protein PAT1-domain-containing protein [Absidia repens]|uniref:Topoisomerase II-associated protein PAT1-domain-containing protein n=1 Tax=Absidia repens TaxID=90262 RepID=A0A1X2HK60_9FUNG|nr:topoisomerase II-associated protein PAT1-domain-containing protein [Absidia repens]